MAKQTDPRVLARSPCHLLKRASQFAASIYMDQVGRTGLTQRQFAVLMAAERNEGASQTELVGLTGIDRSTLADLVARLMAQGYLQARRGREDGRTNAVRLTAAGRRALRAAEPGAGEADKLLIAAVPAKHRKGFIEGLMSLASQLEAEEPPAPKEAKPRKARATPARSRGAKAAKSHDG
jgi:DNA-binding MarR family transcriptional regulator